MAFAVASKKGAPLASLLKNLLLAAPSSSSALHPASFTACRRLFSTAGDAPFSREETMGDEEFLFYHGLPGTTSPTFFTEACQGWVSKQDEDVLQVKMEMPGLEAEHVKMWTSPKLGLLIKGVDAARVKDQNHTWYTGRIGLPPDAFELDKAQTEMKDGVLTVTVPRVKVDLGEESTEINVRNAKVE